MNNSGITIRAATDDDKDAVLALAPRLAEGLPPWRNAGEALAAGRRWLEDSLAAAAAASAAGDAAVFVAVDTASIVGVISVRASRHFTGERDGYIGELVVAERAARRGIGSALVAAADDWGREHGLANLTLHTGAFNTPARAFYAAIGFAAEEVRLTRAVSPVLPGCVHLAKQLLVRTGGLLQQQFHRVLAV